MSVRRKSSRRRRDDSDSDSSSSDYQSSSERPQDLFKSLKGALVDRSTSGVYRAIQKLERNYKETQGILRIAIPDSFSFSQADIEEFFKKFGRIERIVLKQSIGKTVVEEQVKSKQGSSLAYVIYCQYCSAILAMKVLNSVSEKERIFTAKICHSHPISNEAKLFCEPLIGTQAIDDMVITVERDCEFGDIVNSFKYVGTIGVDMLEKGFHLRQRILGVQGCNFIRIQYLCEKSFKFQHEHEESKLQDLVMKLVSNQETGMEREVLVLSNSIQKYNQAIRCLHQLLEQIVEEYKNSKQKMAHIIPRDIHIRKWERFQVEAQLKFIT